MFEVLIINTKADQLSEERASKARFDELSVSCSLSNTCKTDFVTFGNDSIRKKMLPEMTRTGIYRQVCQQTRNVSVYKLQAF